MRIAILDLQPVGVSELTAKTVSDLLRTELFNTGLFIVIEREQMTSVLKEQGFQQSGCTETECAVQVGKLLSAHKVLVGTVNKLGTSFIINARIIDVEKGTMDFGEKAVVESEEKLPNGCEEFARKLAKRITGKEEPSPVQTETISYRYPLRTIGYISAGVGILSLGAGLLYNNQVIKNNNDATTLFNNYYSASSDFDTAYNAYTTKLNQADKLITTRNIFYITSGATLSFGIVSIFIIRSPIDEKVSINLGPNQIKFAYKF